MSFDKLDTPDLRKLATEEFGLEVPEEAKSDEIIHQLLEAGVTWEAAVQHDEKAAEIDRAEKASGETQEKPKRGRPPKANEDAPEEKETALLRMMRLNRRYEVREYTFTQENPFCLVDEDTAAWIVENIEGFRYATPKEVKEYYG